MVLSDNFSNRKHRSSSPLASGQVCDCVRVFINGLPLCNGERALGRRIHFLLCENNLILCPKGHRE